MWNSIANLKENLHKIALDVHEDSEDDDGDDGQKLEIRSKFNGSDRRMSNLFSDSSPLSNGFKSPSNSEIEQYKAEIKRLQESESEIKALSINYAAILKEKEDQISRLNVENGSLRKNLDATNASLKASRTESQKASSSSPGGSKGNGSQSPSQSHKLSGQAKNRISNGFSNGIAEGNQPDATKRKMDGKNANLQELTELLEERNKSLAAEQANHELQMKQLRLEIERERDKFSTLQKRMQEEQKMNSSFQEDLKSIQMEKDKMSMEMSKIQHELNQKASEIRQLKMEQGRQKDRGADNIVESLKGVIAKLEKENSTLKMEKDEIMASLKATTQISPDINSSSQNVLREVNLAASPREEELEVSLRKLDKDLKEACRGRDKAVQELNRLKQHLLDKESEESEKMDEDTKVIEELRQKNEYKQAQILQLERTLKQAIASRDEVKVANNAELQRYKETVEDLNRRLASCMTTIDAKNVELLNLQTALGQYYAEIEAMEHLERDLVAARGDSAKLSELLKDAHEQMETLRREKEEIQGELSQAERMLGESSTRVSKLEEDNDKLRRALEQSMTRLNRMSMDSDYFVDRRIVIKLLVTYFQRNHSKEVLDLMVRMLGFSEEDKQRIGMAQQGKGKGVVRGVLGIPGRLVGGILGGGTAEVHTHMTSDDQSFADLWVDFLLKETEERERREAIEANGISKEGVQGSSPGTGKGVSPDRRSLTPMSDVSYGFARSAQVSNQNSSPLPIRGNLFLSEQSDSEFSTVPLTTPDGSTQTSRLHNY